MTCGNASQVVREPQKAGVIGGLGDWGTGLNLGARGRTGNKHLKINYYY